MICGLFSSSFISFVFDPLWWNSWGSKFVSPNILAQLEEIWRRKIFFLGNFNFFLFYGQYSVAEDRTTPCPWSICSRYQYSYHRFLYIQKKYFHFSCFCIPAKYLSSLLIQTMLIAFSCISLVEKYYLYTVLGALSFLEKAKCYLNVVSNKNTPGTLPRKGDLEWKFPFLVFGSFLLDGSIYDADLLHANKLT